MNSGEITQEYDQHPGPVTFVDENRHFVTTSDDKTIVPGSCWMDSLVQYVMPDINLT